LKKNDGAISEKNDDETNAANGAFEPRDGAARRQVAAATSV